MALNLRVFNPFLVASIHFHHFRNFADSKPWRFPTLPHLWKFPVKAERLCVVGSVSALFKQRLDGCFRGSGLWKPWSRKTCRCWPYWPWSSWLQARFWMGMLQGNSIFQSLCNFYGKHEVVSSMYRCFSYIFSSKKMVCHCVWCMEVKSDPSYTLGPRLLQYPSCQSQASYL